MNQNNAEKTETGAFFTRVSQMQSQDRLYASTMGLTRVLDHGYVALSPLAPLRRPSADSAPRMGSAKPKLGSTGTSFGTKSDEDRSNRQCRRLDRSNLRRKVRKWADRTMVNVMRPEVDPVTGEVVGEYIRTQAPKDDKYLACGRRMRSGAGMVGLHLDGDYAGVSGVMTCGSAWVCPVCSAKIQQHRAGELGRVLAWARAEGYSLAMITLTVRHSRKHSLDGVWDAVSDGWHAVTSGKEWGSEKVGPFMERLERWEAQRQLALEGKARYPRNGRANIPPVRRVGDQETYGVVGWARAVEVTQGLNGWHVHVHAVVVLAVPSSETQETADALGSRMFARWKKGLNKTGFTAVEHKGGLHVSVKAAAEHRLVEYLTKDQHSTGDSRAKIIASNGKQARKLAAEAALGDAKSGKRGGKTPFQLLDSIDEENPGKELALWREFVEGSAGRLALTWSQGLRDLAGMPPEGLTDEEAAAQPEAGPLVLSVPRETWMRICDDLPEYLTVLEEDGLAGLLHRFEAERLAYELPIGKET